MTSSLHIHTFSYAYIHTIFFFEIKKGEKMVSQKLSTQGNGKEEGEEVDRNIRYREVRAEVYTMSKPSFLPNPFHCAFSDQTSEAEPGLAAACRRTPAK